MFSTSSEPTYIIEMENVSRQIVGTRIGASNQLYGE